MKLYINGILHDSAPKEGYSLTFNGVESYIGANGAHINTSPRYFKGDIAYVQMYEAAADCSDYDADTYVSVTCAGDDCDDTNPDVNPGMKEIPGNGLDDDCNPATPDETRRGVSPAEAAFHGSRSSSCIMNSLGYLLVPAGAVLVLSIWRRKRRESNPILSD